jgi:hypothetical protein
MALIGTHHVRALKSALHKAKKIWPAVGARMDVRRQSLKLRYWGQRVGRQLLDLDYEPIAAMPGSGVYELRVDDEIGGHRNIRILFLDPPDSWKPAFSLTLPVIWILEAIPKKRNNWTNFDIERFQALRTTVKQRLYQ